MSKKRLSKLDAPKVLIEDEAVMKDNDFIISKTDTKGFITYCNKIFMDMCQYSEDELIGANHNLIRHPDMPKVAFKLLWTLIQQKQEFFGFVKNLRKDGGYYWVYANITASLDLNGSIIGYYSVRRKPSRKGIQTLIPIYKELVRIETSGGVSASEAFLNDFLQKQGISYMELVTQLQDS